jgi:hypothetical protein
MTTNTDPVNRFGIKRQLQMANTAQGKGKKAPPPIKGGAFLATAQSTKHPVLRPQT